MSRWASRVNDSSLENLIAGARSSSLIMVPVVMADALAWLWTGDGRWGLTAGLFAVMGSIAGWWGWWVMGNREWAPSRMCPAVWGDLRCNVQVDKDGRHEGRHQDGLRDPEGASLWS